MLNEYNDRRAMVDRPATVPMLESQATGFSNRALEIVKLTSRLNDIANRTFGRMGTSGEAKPPVTPVPECTLAKLNESGEQLDKAITGLGQAIDRFDSL